ALACVRAWFYVVEGGRGWEEEARASTERALSRAPEIAETHLAAGIRVANYADYRAAVRSLEHALSIAPTCAPAHEYLGMLQCEAGRAKEGIRHIEQSISLDPTLMYGGLILARAHALEGDLGRCEAALVDLDRRIGPAARRLTSAVRLRVAAWSGDQESLRR